jgi:hypothetical protein
VPGTFVRSVRLRGRYEMKSFETAISLVLMIATQALTVGVIFAA